jgi:hypothetical protein
MRSANAATGVLPPLLILRAVTVRLPEYIVLALETIASEDGTTVDAALGFRTDRICWIAPDAAATHHPWLPAGVPVPCPLQTPQ